MGEGGAARGRGTGPQRFAPGAPEEIPEGTALRWKDAAGPARAVHDGALWYFPPSSPGKGKCSGVIRSAKG